MKKTYKLIALTAIILAAAFAFTACMPSWWPSWVGGNRPAVTTPGDGATEPGEPDPEDPGYDGPFLINMNPDRADIFLGRSFPSETELQQGYISDLAIMQYHTFEEAPYVELSNQKLRGGEMVFYKLSFNFKAAGDFVIVWEYSDFIFNHGDLSEEESSGLASSAQVRNFSEVSSYLESVPWALYDYWDLFPESLSSTLVSWPLTNTLSLLNAVVYSQGGRQVPYAANIYSVFQMSPLVYFYINDYDGKLFSAANLKMHVLTPQEFAESLNDWGLI